LHVSMTEIGVGPHQPKKHIPKRVYQKIQNLAHKYETTKT
jgi:hypothetical protein